MRLTRYVCGLVGQMVSFAVRTRRPGLLFMILLGFLAVAVTVVMQFAAPIVIYPLL